MKIAVCSLYINPWYLEIVKYGKKTLENYCQKYNYDFIFETESTLDSVYDGQREAPWYKIKLLKKILETNKYDMVVWNDADSLIMSDKNSLEYYIEKHMLDKDILLASEYNCVLNTGTMFFKNTDYNKEILQLIWDNESNFDPCFHEQASFGDLYLKNINNLHDNTIILPPTLQNEFLTYWSIYDQNNCFILHITRCSNDKAGFIYTLDMFCPIQMDEENEDDFIKRKEWIQSQQCLIDIANYRNGTSARIHPSKRYIKYLNNQYILP